MSSYSEIASSATKNLKYSFDNIYSSVISTVEVTLIRDVYTDPTILIIIIVSSVISLLLVFILYRNGYLNPLFSILQNIKKTKKVLISKDTNNNIKIKVQDRNINKTMNRDDINLKKDLNKEDINPNMNQTTYKGGSNNYKMFQFGSKNKKIIVGRNIDSKEIVLKLNPSREQTIRTNQAPII
tara:strand:- start:141 stop:689 length:549 start_codon:yes stop_codon:yes gene_type:complete